MSSRSTATDRKQRVALVGCGFFSANHLAAWRELAERVEIVGVCDIDPQKARLAAERFGIARAFGDVEDMLAATKPDFLDIVTTAPSHRMLVETAAAHGIDAIVQKPIAPNWEDALALVEAMAKAGRTLMVHENFRFQTALLRAQELLRAGAIGTPTWARFSFRTGYDIYAGQPYLAQVERFILLDLGIHMLDVARVFMGEAETVYCRTQSVRPGLKGEDMATVVLGHESGATSLVDLTYQSLSMPDPFPQPLMELEGTKGAIRIDYPYRLTLSSRDGAQTETVAPAPLAWGAEPWLATQRSIVEAQRHWLDCLEQRREPATSGRDNLRTFALVEAAYRSAQSDAVVRPASIFPLPADERRERC